MRHPVLGEQISAVSTAVHLYIRVRTYIQMENAAGARLSSHKYHDGGLLNTLIVNSKNKVQCLTSTVEGTQSEDPQKNYIIILVDNSI